MLKTTIELGQLEKSKKTYWDALKKFIVVRPQSLADAFFDFTVVVDFATATEANPVDQYTVSSLSPFRIFILIDCGDNCD